MSTTLGLCLEALDVLFFRDGRPFGAATRAASGLPMPQTLAGALRTALLERAGCDFAKLRGHPVFVDAVRAACTPAHHWIGEVVFRGPWLARWPDGGGGLEVLVPAPATLHRQKKEKNSPLFRLAPLPAGQLPGWQPPEDTLLRPLWLRQRVTTEPAEGYLTPDGFRAFLHNQEVPATALVPRGKLFDFDHRTGIGIEPDRLAAEKSLIYGTSFLVLHKNVVLYAELVLPDGVAAGVLDGLTVLPFGGEGRRVRVSLVPRFDWCEPPAGPRTLLMLTTPGQFATQAPWRPQGLPLAAAAVPGAVAVSGWDLARGGPKPTRFAAAAGSVYFLDGTPDGLPPGSLADAPEDRLQGWGCYLKGVWTDA
jgi:CRISPR-associated protein Cmr3